MSENKNENETAGQVGLVAAAGVLGMILAVFIFMLILDVQKASWQREAVQHGAAEWVIVDPATGKTEWRWKETVK